MPEGLAMTAHKRGLAIGVCRIRCSCLQLRYGFRQIKPIGRG